MQEKDLQDQGRLSHLPTEAEMLRESEADLSPQKLERESSSIGSRPAKRL